MKKWIKILLIIIIFAGLLAGYLVWGNSSVGVTEYTVSPANLPKSFNGFRIVQVSDLHNDKFSGLLEKISDAKPDIIVLTGDLIDFYETDIPVAVEFAKNVVKIAPVYYVSGNHEYRTGQYDVLRPQLIEAGVKVLESETVKINRNGEEISITGINDPTFFGSGEDNADMDAFSAELKMLAEGADSDVNILLSHIPQILPLYAECGFDLVFTGHAHGGQFRFPIIGGGFFAPGQGWWPDYSEGMHTSGNTDMIISRGLGNSAFPLRLFNRPELVICELSGETK
ncbi:MAG: metallophosphoesterase [Acutalibacteraceae bacterium]|nr:metallophosphoesterase [Acutalibacteraceae bacterium]